jgi:hypothetical protein
MSDSTVAIRRDALVALLRSSSSLDVSLAAIEAVESMAAADLPVGHSTAGSFVAIMRRRLTSALDIGVEFVGWRELEASLLLLDPAVGICGVALDGGGSVVLSSDLGHVVGALVRGPRSPRHLAEDE